MNKATALCRDYALTDAERCDCLRAKIEVLRARMAPEEVAVFDQLTCEWMNGGPPPTGLEIKAAWAPDFINKPVGIRQFIYEDQFLGRALGGSIYPRIVDDLEQLFEGDYQEVVLSGSQRWGKSVFAQVGLAYEIYCVSCLRDPGKAFGSLPGTKLAFVNASLTLQQAKRVIFAGLFRLFKQSPYFCTIFPYNGKITSEIRFRRGGREDVICYPVAANEQAFMGIDIFSAAIDEANFMQVIEKSKLAVPGEGSGYDQVEAIYNRLLVRLKGSWNHPTGIPGHMWLISSARFPGDFTERKELEARDNTRIFVRRYAIWDTKPGFADTPLFPVEVGDVTRRSRVLADDVTAWPRDVNLDRVIRVPVKWKPDFVRNPEKCVRDLAGISVLSITPFIPRREAIRRMFELGMAAGMQPTFTQLEVTLQNPLPETEQFIPGNLHWALRHQQDQLGRPLYRDPLGREPLMESVLFPVLYYAHIDLSKTECATGIVVGHAIGGKQVPRLDEKTGKMVYETKPVVRVDLALRVVAPAGGEIDIPKVRSLIYKLRNLGLEFGLVTFDTYGSQESVKSLNDAGYRSDVYSLERDLTPWEEMKQALYDERLLCYEFPHLEKELAQLELVKGRIEKPAHAGASKDVADCLAAVVHHVEEGWRRGEGSRNLFQFGIVERPGQLGEPSVMIQEPTTKIVTGQPLTAEEEDRLLFGDLDKL